MQQYSYHDVTFYYYPDSSIRLHASVSQVDKEVVLDRFKNGISTTSPISDDFEVTHFFTTRQTQANIFTQPCIITYITNLGCKDVVC